MKRTETQRVIDALEDEMMAIIIETAHDYALAGTDKGIEIKATGALFQAEYIGPDLSRDDLAGLDDTALNQRPPDLQR